MGVFGTVALVAGPGEISKLSPSVRLLVITLVVAAGVLAAIAIIDADRAREFPQASRANWSGKAYRSYVIRNAASARIRLRRSRRLGYMAGVIVFIVGVVALIDGALL